MRLIIFMISVIVMLSPSLVTAQQQIAFDQNDEIYVIDRQLRNQLELFPDYEGFIEATMFRIDENEYELNVLVEIDGIRQRRLEEYSDVQLKNLRDRITQRLAELDPETDQSGRTRFLIGTTALSAAYYGWATPTILGINEPSVFGALYLTVASSGYFIPNWVTSDATLTTADSRLSLYGGLRGIYHGYAIGNFIAPDETGAEISKGHLAISMATSLSGLYGGYAYSRNQNVTEGEARFFNAAGDYGMLMGIGSAIILEDTFFSTRLSTAGYLSITSAGYAGAHYLTRHRNATIGNARVMRTSYFLGAAIPAGFLAALDIESSQLITATTMAGLSAGMGWASRISRSQNFTDGEGITISLGTLGSYLLGASIGLLATDSSSGVLLTGALGGSLGYFTLLNRAMQQQNPDNSEYSLNFDFGFQPVIEHEINAYSFVPVLKLSKSF